MSTTQTLILGAIAGATIFLGLPMGRVGAASKGLRAGLTAFAAGILIFLLWDVLGHGVDPVEVAVEEHHWGRLAELGPLLAGGLVVGLMSLVYYDRWMMNKRSTPLVGPGAAAIDEFDARSWVERLTPGRRLALLIATGIGLHNFGEGLAIGQAAAANEVSLALVLIIGFALHNATEGFGIVGPMSGESERPSWGFLGLMGLIGGGPTFVGTVIGQAWVSEALQVAFFAVAAGSILYVVIQLLEVCRRYALPVVVAWWILAGIVLGFATDFVLVAAGA
ncbi:MAG: ZIP family metal transporter [Gaiellaceae bacterium]